MSDTLVHNENKAGTAVEVRTFGGFSIIYRGEEISFGLQNESQIVHLLQLLLHFREDGVSRELAKAELFGDRAIDDVSHSIRNIIYNLRKKLRELDFPDSRYVVKKEGVYFWADDVEVIEDASEFEALANQALELRDDKVKEEMLDRAVHMYSGRFLNGDQSSVWAVAEAERYRDLFGQCVNELADILRHDHKFSQLYDLSIYATQVDPLSEWEILTLESMSGLGLFDQTEKFFDDTVAKYNEEFGGSSSNYLRSFVNRLGMKLVIGNESIEEIQKKMHDTAHQDKFGYYCSLPVFQEIYRIAERMMQRSGDRLYLMLCTILDGKGNPMLTGTRLEDLSARLKDAIIKSVRHTDTITRYGNGQYLILLIDTSYEDCSTIASRINTNFIRPGQRTSVRYTVNNVITSDQVAHKKCQGAREVPVNKK